MTNKISLLSEQLKQMSIAVKLDEPMSRHTSFHCGGSAAAFVEASTVDELCRAVELVDKMNIKRFILGNGTNVLIGDEGFDGVVLDMTGLNTMTVEENLIRAGAGCSLMKICRAALDNSFTGLEFAYGIPGTVGGGVYMNAGAYGSELKEVLRSVTHLTPDGKRETVNACDLDLGYRRSFYTAHGDYVILEATFELKAGEKSEIKGKMDELLGKRQNSQPLEFSSAGSTFKRPQGAFAGRLIEQCGLKGERVGGAMVSEKHAGFIINYDNATATDVISLIKKVQQTVLEKTGYFLETEVKII